MISNEQIITCYFCFETFSGHNTEIFDCEVFCNPNKIETEVYEGEVSFITVSDGNE